MSKFSPAEDANDGTSEPNRAAESDFAPKSASSPQSIATNIGDAVATRPTTPESVAPPDLCRKGKMLLIPPIRRPQTLGKPTRTTPPLRLEPLLVSLPQTRHCQLLILALRRFQLVYLGASSRLPILSILFRNRYPLLTRLPLPRAALYPNRSDCLQRIASLTGCLLWS